MALARPNDSSFSFISLYGVHSAMLYLTEPTHTHMDFVDGGAGGASGDACWNRVIIIRERETVRSTQLVYSST